MLRFAAAAAFAVALASPAAAQVYLPAGALNDRDTQEFNRRESRSDYAGALEILAKAPGAEPKIASCRKDFATDFQIMRCAAMALSLEFSRREYDAALRASRK